MGFSDVSLIRKALQLGKNDLNEAVSYLTCEVPMSSHETFNDVEMQEVNSQNYNQDPPSYANIYESSSSNGNSESQKTEEMQQDSDDLTFPYERLVELEDRVFVEVWSIPYKTDESFAKCLVASTRLTKEGLASTDENCQRFIDRCMPECFDKLLKSSAVHRWALDVQEGIHEMLHLFIDLLIATLEKSTQPPVGMLKVLAMAFDPETDWNYKNRGRTWQQTHWETKLGGSEKVYARPQSNAASYINDQHGWMVNLINTFCEKGGLVKLQKVVETCEILDASQFTAVLKPFGLCAEYLNPKTTQEYVSPIIEQAGKYVRELQEDDFKQKKLGSVSELLTIMKLIYRELWSKDVTSVDELRLAVTLRMLKSPHFNAKMNALKELTKLIDDSQSFSSKIKKNAMESEKILDWLLSNNVLIIALDSHIDQSQYCDKMRTIVEFIGNSMTMEELSHMWQMQNNQSLSVSENVQSILSAAAVHFNDSQLDQLFQLIHHSWLREDEKRRQQLVSFIGRIGHNSRQSKPMEKVLDLLWDLSHLPKLPAHLVEFSMKEHHAILNDSYHVRESLKKTFIIRCIEDIKKDTWVVPALKQMYDIANTYGKTTYNTKSDRGVLFEMNKQHDLLKLIVTSLTRCHKVAAYSATEQRAELQGELIVDGKYKHADFMYWHLQFLRFLLKDANIYLPWNRAKEVWDTLVTNRDSCIEDNETCFEWFGQSLDDLENDTAKLLFRERLLRLDPAQMCPSAYHCLMKFMEATNINEQRMKKSSGNLYVEKLDLLGIDFLWRVCLECPCEDVAELAISTLVRFSYIAVSVSLKRDQRSLHSRFIAECYKRLQQSNTGSDNSVIAHAMTKVTKTLAANILPEVNMPTNTSGASKLLMTERILLLAERYVTEVEQLHTDTRTLLPHGAVFWGSPIKITVTSESPKLSFIITTHSNDTIQNVRSRVALHMNSSTDQVQMTVNERTLPPSQDRRLLRMVPFHPHQDLIAKTTVSPATIIPEEEGSSSQNKSSLMMEKEQKLPSVVMANKGNDTFEVIYQLTELNESRITQQARSLILLIPSDPQILKSLKQVCNEDSTREDGDSPMKSKNNDSTHSLNVNPERPNALMIDHSPKRQRGPRLSPLESLFKLSSPGMNLFRLRYNLEILSSLLIPVNDQQLVDNNSGEYVKQFLKCGGLQMILNILQSEVVSEIVENQTEAEIRRGCYTTALTIARFLLCDSSPLDDSFSLNRSSRFSMSLEAAATPTSPTKREMEFVSGSIEYSATPTKKNRRSPLSQSPVILPDGVPKVARSAVQVMDEQDFTLLISTLVRITWFASASKLDQVTVAKPYDVDGSSFSRRWSKESSSSSVSVSNISPYVGRSISTGSISSSGSAESESHMRGVHSRHDPPLNPDTVVAQQALELLVTCLQLRSSHIDRFFSLPSVSEFVVDLLTQPSDPDIRQSAVEQFHTLTTIESPNTRGDDPRHQILKIILKARLPLWAQNTFLRSQGQKIVRNCLQYFELRAKLIQDVVEKNVQDKCGVDPKGMLEDEIGWLSNFEVPTSAEYAESSSARVLDNTLLTGHLRLIKTLIACPDIDKKKIGSQLITKLLNEFLFPASKLILDSSSQVRSKRIFADFQPKCSSSDSRSAAFGVLVELCHECTANLQQVSSQLLTMHHYNDLSRSKEFDFKPLVDSRPEHGLVGLKNAGATCYMNSILQQLFMIKNMAPLLCTEFGDSAEETTLLYQLQRIFGHLSESRLQYYIPETFWKTFKLWGQPINVREQQDAYMFFTDLSDQIDEYLKSKSQEPLFKKNLQGLFSDQKICEGCPHKYEREEPYFALNLPVKCGNLHDSLDQFVAGEKLEGDNAYFCEKCNTKRTALKRTCIKTLPPVLIMQLKRFVYDWESGRSLKFDHYFDFPLTLDMSPYTEEGISKQERGRTRHFTSESNMYELVGIVVHSGQASAGHYYSFIKDRRGTNLSNPWRGKWFKFNDITVEEFEMSPNNLAEECFGGTYKSKVYEKGTQYQEDRLRYWNAYLLFYERMGESEVRRNRSSDGKSRVTFFTKPDDSSIHSPLTSSPDTSPPNSPKQAIDKRLSQLSNLIRKGDQRRMFTSKMPASISHLVREENLQFMRNRDVYCQKYFDFVKELASVNLNCVDGFPAIAVTSLQLSTQFLFNTYFRTRRTLTSDIEEWCGLVRDILAKSHPACVWFISQLHTATGFPTVQAFLLECPKEEIRKSFGSIILKTLEEFVTRKSGKEPGGFDILLSRLISLLDREVAEHVKQSQQFFTLLANFTALNARACEATLRHDIFSRLLRFLLGETATRPLFTNGHHENGGGDASHTTQSDATMQESESAGRRWSSVQSREFGPLHSVIANLILHCDFSSVTAKEKAIKSSSYQPLTVQVSQRIALPDSIKHGVFGVVGTRLLQELLTAVREISSSCATISDLICHCAYNNPAYSEKAIEAILSDVQSVPGNELVSLLTLLGNLLSVEDMLHLSRLSLAVEKSPNALLSIVKNTAKQDEPKCYQCIKMLVQLSNRSSANKDYLVSISSQWSFAVSWLNGKMKAFSSYSSTMTTKFSGIRSNETSKFFQRTMSAQNTLEEVTRLLGDKEVSNEIEEDAIEIDSM